MSLMRKKDALICLFLLAYLTGVWMSAEIGRTLSADLCRDLLSLPRRPREEMLPSLLLPVILPLLFLWLCSVTKPGGYGVLGFFALLGAAEGTCGVCLLLGSAGVLKTAALSLPSVPFLAGILSAALPAAERSLTLCRFPAMSLEEENNRSSCIPGVILCILSAAVRFLILMIISQL